MVADGLTHMLYRCWWLSSAFCLNLVPFRSSSCLCWYERRLAKSLISNTWTPVGTSVSILKGVFHFGANRGCAHWPLKLSILWCCITYLANITVEFISSSCYPSCTWSCFCFFDRSNRSEANRGKSASFCTLLSPCCCNSQSSACFIHKNSSVKILLSNIRCQDSLVTITDNKWLVTVNSNVVFLL